MIAKSAIVFPGVILGKNAIIEDFCLIGVPVVGAGRLPTIIGDDAHFRSHTVVYSGTIIGDRFHCGNKANIRENNRIGDDVSIGTLTVLEHSIIVENHVRIHSQAFIPEFTTIKAGAWIGPNCVLTNAKYPNTEDTKLHLRGPTICEGARIGANATILPGLLIGRCSLVGAGSVVTRNVPDNTVVAGNPARELGQVG